MSPLYSLEKKPLTEFDDTTVLKNKYDIALNIAKNYIDFLHSNKVSMTDTKTEVFRVANSWIEEHKFGAKLIQDIENHVITKYRPRLLKLKQEIKDQSSVEDLQLFNNLFDSLVSSPAFESINNDFAKILK